MSVCVCEGGEWGGKKGIERGGVRKEGTKEGASMIAVKEEGGLAYILPHPIAMHPPTHTHLTHTHSPLSTSTDVSNLELGLDDVSDEGVMEGDPSNQHIGVPAAMKVINNEGGRKVSSKAEAVPKDAYFAFLLLRHLRIRDMRNKVGIRRAVAMVMLYTVTMSHHTLPYSTILHHTLPYSTILHHTLV